MPHHPKGSLQSHVPREMATCPNCFNALARDRFDDKRTCPACRVVYRVKERTSLEYPPGASRRSVTKDNLPKDRVVPNQLAWKPVPLVAHELARFPEGLTYDRLKEHLATLFVERSIRDRYLRFYLERGIEDGIIRVENGVFFAVVTSA